MSQDFKLAKSLSRRTFLKGVGVATGATVFGGSSILRAQSDIVIGTNMPLTGALGFLGVGFQEIVEMVAAEVNAAGGLLGGRNVVVDGRDSESTDAGALASATALINVSNVPAVIGPARSGAVNTVAQIHIDNGVVLCSPSSTAPGIDQLDDNDLIFRTAPNDKLQGRVLADLAFNVRGYRRVAIISLNDDYGQGLAGSFTDNFTALGGTITSNNPYDAATTDFSAQLAAAAADDPEAICPITFQEIETLYINAFDQGLDQLLDLWVDGNKSTEAIANIAAQVGTAVNGVVGTVPGAAEVAGGVVFPQLVQDNLGRAVGPAFEPQTYDAAAAVMLAIEAAGEASGAGIAASMRSVTNPDGQFVTVGQLGVALDLIRAGTAINFDGAGGTVDFDAGGDVIGPIATWGIVDGVDVTIETLNCTVDACDAIGDPSQYPSRG
jgi:branched-chain amino acid transport system substrate-binding protein